MLRFLDKRMISNANTSSTGANLVSCGGIGFVRFWNVHAGKLISEFQAHTDGRFQFLIILFRFLYLCLFFSSFEYHHGNRSTK